MTTPLSVKSEMKRLHRLGFGIHWLRPKSKVPVKGGWTNSKRDSLGTLKSEYKKGYNIGTKLGEPSQVGFGSYLACIDVDVKGTEKKHQNAALNWIRENLPGVLEEAPITLSGRGNGSMHIWLTVDSPIDSRALSQSSEEVEVMMPSAKPTDRQIEILGKKKIKKGWRLRPAWEIDFMCAGRQVVLPPSIHPDTGKPYRWKKGFNDASEIPFFDAEGFFEALPEQKKKSGRPTGSGKSDFVIVDPDEFDLEMKLQPNILDGIYDGDNVSDRSAMALSVALAMVSAKFSDAEILGVLTNRDYYIGDCAYEHAKTNQRQRAARWAFDYCIRKARQEADPTFIFQSEIEEYEQLSEEGKKKQKKRLESKDHVDWRKTLDRDKYDAIKPTYFNIKAILENDVGEGLFFINDFAYSHHTGMDTPWGKKKGEEITDVDKNLIKDWIVHKWGIEPSTHIIEEVIVTIAERNRIHPVREYLSNLQWDGVARLDTWLETYLGAEGPEEYLRAIGRKFLVAMITRIFEPGKKFDYMLILEGTQGIGKSTVGSVLASPEWFLDSLPDLNDKDAALNLRGHWLCEMGELAHLRRADVETTKAFISRTTDKVRPPFGKRLVTIERQTCFFGTTNQVAGYLKDKTGNRRFWPCLVNDIDRDALIRDRDQLLAEALHVYDMNEETLYLEDEIRDLAEKQQEERLAFTEADFYGEKFNDWLKAVKDERKKLPKENRKLIKFRISDLFGGTDRFADFSCGAPFGDVRLTDTNLQHAVKVVKRTMAFEHKKSNGQSVWTEIPKEKRLVFY